MNLQLTEQLEQVQKGLARNLAEVERIADSLIEVGARLKQEPWKWGLEWTDSAFLPEELTDSIEPEMLAAVDRHRISWLLEDIRILRRREIELKRLALA